MLAAASTRSNPSARTRPLARQALGAQLEALDLASRGLGEFRAKFDPARIFVRRQRRLDVLLQRPRQLLAGLVGGLEHHEGLGLDQLVVVRPGNDRGLQHVWMVEERASNFERRYLVAAGIQESVATPPF